MVALFHLSEDGGGYFVYGMITFYLGYNLTFLFLFHVVNHIQYMNLCIKNWTEVICLLIPVVLSVVFETIDYDITESPH